MNKTVVTKMMIHHKTETFLYPIWLKQTLGHLSLWIVSNFLREKIDLFFRFRKVADFRKKIRKILNFENIPKNFEFQSKNFETNPLLFHPTIKHIAASGTRMTLMNY